VKTYDVAKVSPVLPSSMAWALAYVRMVLKDKPNAQGLFPPNGFEDEEIKAQLELDSRVISTTTFYPAHLTAANLLSGDPERVLSFALGGLSETRPNPLDLAASIRGRGSMIDRLITAAAAATVEPGVAVGY
jgi:hypothetical protein